MFKENRFYKALNFLNQLFDNDFSEGLSKF